MFSNERSENFHYYFSQFPPSTMKDNLSKMLVKELKDELEKRFVLLWLYNIKKGDCPQKV